LYADDVKRYAIEHGLTEDNGIGLSVDITNQLVGHLNDLGIETHGSSEMEEDLRGREEAKVVKAETQAIKDEAIKNGTFMKAPNGKPTKLTEKQWLQVRTKNFKNWFGDWENDPENASKVVDPETGEPMVVYHATDADFTTFSYDNFGKTDSGTVGKGFYFSANKDYVKHYGNKVIAVFLNIKEPVDLRGKGYSRTDIQAYIRNDDKIFWAQTNIGQKRPSDGVIVDQLESIGLNNKTYDSVEYVSFDPNQIKSATDNVGTFSTENDDIRFAIDRFVNKYELPSGELGSLSRTLSSLFGNKTVYGETVRTANYEYTINYRGVEDFDIIEFHRINRTIHEQYDRKRGQISDALIQLSGGDELTEGEYNSDSYDASDGEANGYNAGLDKETSQGESEQTKSDAGSQKHQGWRAVKRDSATGRTTFVDESDFESTAEDWERESDQQFITPQGQVYGYATPEGAIYLDERVIKKSRTCVRDFFIKACPPGQPDCLL